jgi:hypothetical protein
MNEAAGQQGARGWWARWGVFVVPCVVFATIASTRMNQSLWYDELWRTRMFLNERTLHDMLWGDVHNPLYNALMYVWIRVVGDSEVAIRLPSVVCALGVIGLAVWWSRRVVGDVGAWVVGLFLAVSPVMLWHGTEAKNTMLATLGAVWCVVCTERDARWNGDKAKWWRHPAVWLAIGLIVAGWTSWNGLFAAMCATLAMATAWKSVPRRNWKCVGWAWGAAMLALSPILVYKATRVATLMRAHPRHLDWREVILFISNWLPSGNAVWPVQPYEETVRAFQPPHLWFTLGMAAVVMGLLVVGLRVLVQRGVAAWVVRPMWVGVALLFVASAALDHWYGDRRWYIYQERNVLWMVVPLAMVLGAAVGGVGGVGGWRAAWQRVMVAMCVIGLPLVGTVRMMTGTSEAWTVYKPNPDWRSAAELIAADGGASARVLEEETFQLDPLWYYRSELGRDVVPRGADLGAELLKKVESGAVYVVSQQHRWPYRMARLERPGLRVREIGRVSGAVVYRVDRDQSKRN